MSTSWGKAGSPMGSNPNASEREVRSSRSGVTLVEMTLASVIIGVALTGTLLAAAPGDVEGKAAGSVAPHPRLGSAGVELSHLIPEPNVGGGTGSGSLADRCLIDLKDPADLIPSQEIVAADQPGG